jgi:hypothetical protein
MRLRGIAFSTALMTLAMITVKANPPLALLDESMLGVRKESSALLVEHGVALTTPMAFSQDSVFGNAYHQTLNILIHENECSEFFGGVANSIDIFSRLMTKARKGYWPSSVGIRMSGQTTAVLNARTKREYRLFDAVEINSNGPFYKRKFSVAEPVIPNVGSFPPNTKEARVLMLLHELGHAVKGKNGDWLLPNDGNDEIASRSNSLKIEEVCGEEIKTVAKSGELEPTTRKFDSTTAVSQPQRKEP